MTAFELAMLIILVGIFVTFNIAQITACIIRVAESKWRAIKES